MGLSVLSVLSRFGKWFSFSIAGGVPRWLGRRAASRRAGISSGWLRRVAYQRFCELYCVSVVVRRGSIRRRLRELALRAWGFRAHEGRIAGVSLSAERAESGTRNRVAGRLGSARRGRRFSAHGRRS